LVLELTLPLQILDEEEAIALDEFAKLEARLDKDRQREEKLGFSA
jgi:hypothetical protein